MNADEIRPGREIDNLNRVGPVQRVLLLKRRDKRTKTKKSSRQSPYEEYEYVKIYIKGMLKNQNVVNYTVDYRYQYKQRG